MATLGGVTDEDAKQLERAVRGVRQVTLRRLVALRFCALGDPKNPLRRELQKRDNEALRKAIRPEFRGLLSTEQLLLGWMTADDVRAALRCSRRAAYDYLQTLRAIVP